MFLCKNSNIVLNAGLGYQTYEWNNGVLSQSTNINTPGLYWVKVTNECNEIFKDSINVNLQSAIKPINLGSDLFVCKSENIDLKAGKGYSSYLWNNGARDSTIRVNQAGVYWVEVSSGCETLRDSIELKLQSFSDISLYNVITPNTIDDINTNFEVVDVLKGSWLRIYNRWGNLVFESRNYQNEWKGQDMNNTDLPIGVYFYIIQNDCFENTKKGHISIIR